MQVDKNLKLLEELDRTLRYIDPESPRFVEWILLHRSRCGYLNTVVRTYDVPNNRTNVDLDDVVSILGLPQDDGHEIITIQSNEDYRAYVMRDGVISMAVSLIVNKHEINLTCVGEESFVVDVVHNVKHHYATPNKVTIQRVVGYDSQGYPVQFTDEFVDNDAGVLLANDSFYPYLDRSIDELCEQYKKSKSSILFFIGDMGLGKTSLIRTMIFKMGMSENVMMAGDGVVEHPNFIQALHGFDRDSLIGIEDADRICSAREDGNAHMAGLLNFADGVCSVGTKLIISTNLSSVTKVDTALLRSGRTFDVVEFRKLTVEEANIARESVGMEPADFGNLSHISLADALNYETNTLAKRQRTIGFA